MEQHFQKFPKRGQPSEVYPNCRNFFPGCCFSIQLISRNFLEFSVEWFAFGNSTVSGISGNFSGKFLCHLPLFPHFRTVWLNRKRPYSPCSTPRVFDINPSQTIITKKKKQECKCLKLKSLNASPEVNIFHETQLHKC